MKTYVLDASALWAFLKPTASATKVLELLTEAIRGRAEVLMSVVNLGEVYGLVVREEGSERGRATLSAIRELPVRFTDATLARCCHAAEVKNTYRLYYADSFAAALTIESKATLATSDSDFRRLGHNFPILWLKP